VRLILSVLWVALMLTYLLGDVLRIFAGDLHAGEVSGMHGTQVIWLAATILMLIPIVMVVLSVTLVYPAIRWVTIGTTVILFFFNLVGLPTYPGLYDKFLIAVGLVFNGVTVWYAWQWIESK
ncbi:MAG: hypothetical protein KDE58_38785, partial [Caldilineaceae bacterium]|nr:hypothetical protein [Caldilineaceae bacterium]